MMPLSAVVADVLGQLKLAEAGVRPEDCRLLLKGKPLTDLTTPVRFANIGRDKLELHTGGDGNGGGGGGGRHWLGREQLARGRLLAALAS
jgi:hypothetical protein